MSSLFFPLGDSDDYRISSVYGYRDAPTAGASTNHKGIDYAVAGGTDIFAVLDGIVTRSGYSSSYGNVIYVDHGGGFETRYAHMEELSPYQVGDKVSQGTILGGVGSSGVSTGNHLHFETLVDGVKVDPQQYSYTLSIDEGFRGLLSKATDLIPTSVKLQAQGNALLSSADSVLDKWFIPIVILLSTLILLKR